MKQMGLQCEPLAQSIAHSPKLIRSESPEFALKFRERHRLNLLNVKCAGVEEWLGNGNFPLVSSKCSRVRNDGDECQFVVGRIRRQNEAGARLCRHAQIHKSNVTGTECGHFLQACPVPGMPVPPLPLQTEAPHARIRVPAIGVKWRGVRRGSAWAIQKEFQWRSRVHPNPRQIGFNAVLVLFRSMP